MPISLPISHCFWVSGWPSLTDPSWGHGKKLHLQASWRNLTSLLQNAPLSPMVAGLFPVFMPSVQTKGTKQLCLVPTSSHRNPRDAAWICPSPPCTCCFSRILAFFQRAVGLEGSCAIVTWLSLLSRPQASTTPKLSLRRASSSFVQNLRHKEPRAVS